MPGTDVAILAGYVFGGLACGISLWMYEQNPSDQLWRKFHQESRKEAIASKRQNPYFRGQTWLQSTLSEFKASHPEYRRSLELSEFQSRFSPILLFAGSITGGFVGYKQWLRMDVLQLGKGVTAMFGCVWAGLVSRWVFETFYPLQIATEVRKKSGFRVRASSYR